MSNVYSKREERKKELMDKVIIKEEKLESLRERINKLEKSQLESIEENIYKFALIEALKENEALMIRYKFQKKQTRQYQRIAIDCRDNIAEEMLRDLKALKKEVAKFIINSEAKKDE